MDTTKGRPTLYVELKVWLRHKLGGHNVLPQLAKASNHRHKSLALVICMLTYIPLTLIITKSHHFPSRSAIEIRYFIDYLAIRISMSEIDASYLQFASDLYYPHCINMIWPRVCEVSRISVSSESCWSPTGIKHTSCSNFYFHVA